MSCTAPLNLTQVAAIFRVASTASLEPFIRTLQLTGANPAPFSVATETRVRHSSHLHSSTQEAKLESESEHHLYDYIMNFPEPFSLQSSQIPSTLPKPACILSPSSCVPNIKDIRILGQFVTLELNYT